MVIILKMLIEWLKKHQKGCVSGLLLLVAAAAFSVAAMLGSQQKHGHADDTISVFGSDTGESVTETEAVTEPPVPYYTAELDQMYVPKPHTEDVFASVSMEDADYRFYAVMPETDSEGFNRFCESTVFSLATAAKSEQSMRLGGWTVVSVDYILYTDDTVYSVVFCCTETDCQSGTSQVSPVVLIYDTEQDCVYAPLDLYDLTVAAEPLAAAMRTGFERAFAKLGMEADDAFLDAHCIADPASFVNIAMDGQAFYFYQVYDGADAPVLLCSRVSKIALRNYTWEAIALAQQPEEEQKQSEEEQKKEEEQTVPEPVELPVYDFSGAVPENDIVDDDYFNDALFIGNSLIVGLQRAVPLNAQYLASIGLSVSQTFIKECIPLSDGSFTTVSAALELVNFEKVYLMFGINELGWGSIASFIGYYEKLIDRIREVNEDAVIYVQSILPVNDEKWANSPDYQSCINNVAILTFNSKIFEMCQEKNVLYVNVAEALTDENGNLFSDATSDGIHVGGTYAKKWVDYLKTHTVSKS